jgi:hypothetical protein
MPPDNLAPAAPPQNDWSSAQTGQPITPQPASPPEAVPMPGNMIAPTPAAPVSMPSVPPPPLVAPITNPIVNNFNVSPPPQPPSQPTSVPQPSPVPYNAPVSPPANPSGAEPALQNLVSPVPQQPTYTNPITPPQPAQPPFGSVDGIDPALVAKENIYTEICSQIIKEQEKIIGSLAIEQAKQVDGLTVDSGTYHCTVTGNGSAVIDNLIEQYRNFFGHAAVEVCKEAAARFISRLPSEELPSLLR